MYKEDLTLNNLQWLICHKIKPKQIYIYIYIYIVIHRQICFVLSELISARGVVVIVVGNGHGDSSSNPGQD